MAGGIKVALMMKLLKGPGFSVLAMTRRTAFGCTCKVRAIPQKLLSGAGVVGKLLAFFLRTTEAIMVKDLLDVPRIT